MAKRVEFLCCLTVCVHSAPLQNCKWRNEKLSAKRHQGLREIKRQGSRDMLAVDMLEGMLERICEWSDQTRAGSCLCDLVWPCAVKAEGSIPSGSFKVGG